MAKAAKGDLPYFKFQISAWNGGDILQCSLTSQGLFINLCALYWGKRGELYFSKMLKKFPRKQRYFSELLDEGVIKLSEDKIVISFLDEQLADRGAVSEQNTNNANARWNQNKSNAIASHSHNGRTTAAPYLEKKREEEKRKEKNIRAREGIGDSRGTADDQVGPKSFVDDRYEPLSEAWWKNIFNEIYLSEKAMTFREHDVGAQLKMFKSKVIGAPAEYIYRDTDGIRKAFDYQLRNTKPDLRNGTSASTKNERNTSSLIAGFAARHGSDAAE